MERLYQKELIHNSVGKALSPIRDDLGACRRKPVHRPPRHEGPAGPCKGRAGSALEPDVGLLDKRGLAGGPPHHNLRLGNRVCGLTGVAAVLVLIQCSLYVPICMRNARVAIMNRRAQTAAELMVSNYLVKLQSPSRSEEANARLREGVDRLSREPKGAAPEVSYAVPKIARGLERRKALRSSGIRSTGKLRSMG